MDSGLQAVADLHNFRNVWYALSLRGKCDELDGHEYKRVLSLWIAAERPRPITKWIVAICNLPPRVN